MNKSFFPFYFEFLNLTVIVKKKNPYSLQKMQIFLKALSNIIYNYDQIKPFFPVLGAFNVIFPGLGKSSIFSVYFHFKSFQVSFFSTILNCYRKRSRMLADKTRCQPLSCSDHASLVFSTLRLLEGLKRLTVFSWVCLEDFYTFIDSLLLFGNC